MRLYSGPAYQPINRFLRAVANVTDEHRLALAQSTQVTFTATVRLLTDAIRKLAAVATPEEQAQELWRGVRGELPSTFWLRDKQGMICAVDMAFMSTSRNRETPIRYMEHGTPNVLWHLQPQLETDSAFHHGAHIKLLSQFAGEDEVLYPPCTMLLLAERAAAASDEQHSPADRMRNAVEKVSPRFEARLERSRFQDSQTEDGKRYTSISVLPHFL